MTTELNLIAALSHHLAEPLTVAQKEALQRAVSKIVALGAHVGVNRDQRILLESGLAVGELLEYLAARSGEVGLKRSNLVLKFCPVGEICGSPLTKLQWRPEARLARLCYLGRVLVRVSRD